MDINSPNCQYSSITHWNNTWNHIHLPSSQSCHVKHIVKIFRCLIFGKSGNIYVFGLRKFSQGGIKKQLTITTIVKPSGERNILFHTLGWLFCVFHITQWQWYNICHWQHGLLEQTCLTIYQMDLNYSKLTSSEQGIPQTNTMFCAKHDGNMWIGSSSIDKCMRFYHLTEW